MKIERKKVEVDKILPENLIEKIFLVYPKKDDNLGFGFIKLSNDKNDYKNLKFGQYKNNLWFDIGFNVLKRDEHDRVWLCDEIDVSEFEIYYPTKAEIQLFNYAFKKEIKEITEFREKEKKEIENK